MGSVNLIRSCLDSIRQISGELSDAILYIDAGCSEAFESLGAFPLLLELGAQAVCSLENASSFDDAIGRNVTSMLTVKKIVFVTSRLLSDAHRYILRCLSMHADLMSCNIYTSISEVAHSACADSPLGPDAFQEYESLLLQDYEELLRKSKMQELKFHQSSDLAKTSQQESLSSMMSQLASSEECTLNSEANSTERNTSRHSSMETDGCPRLVISVRHFPMILCVLSPRVFVLPSEGTLGEALLSSEHEDGLSPGLPAISTGVSSNGDDIPSGAVFTAHFLYELVSKMDLKIEIFSLGDLSRTIGKILTDMSSLYDVGRRNKRSAGLLLVDRSLDLLTPCLHGDSLIDRMLSSLPQTKPTTLSPQSKLSQSKHAATKVARSSFRTRIPLPINVNKELSDLGKTQLSDSIAAFASAWNFKSSEFDIADLTNQRDIFDVRSSLGSHDFDDLSGSLMSSESYMAANYMEALLDRRTKDGAMLIKKWLIETIRREKIPFTIKGRMTAASASDLHSLTTLLASDEKSLIRNKGIILIALAAEIALSEPHISRWDAFMSAERILSVSADDTSQSLSSQIRDLINTSTLVRSGDSHGSYESSHGLLSFQDALLLAVIGYILAGETFPTASGNSPFSWDEERSLREAIVDAILEMPKTPDFRFLHGLEVELEANSSKGELGKDRKASTEPSLVEDYDDQWGSWEDDVTDHDDEQAYGSMQLKLELRDRVDNLFKHFHKLSGMKYRNPASRQQDISLDGNFGSDIYNRRCFLSKLTSMVLAKHDIPGIEYHSSVVGRFFKSGFGRFGLGQSKPSLGDQNMLLIFVVGGINGLEVYEVQKAISEGNRPDVELILGGTTILTADDMFEMLLGSSSYI